MASLPSLSSFFILTPLSILNPEWRQADNFFINSSVIFSCARHTLFEPDHFLQKGQKDPVCTLTQPGQQGPVVLEIDTQHFRYTENILPMRHRIEYVFSQVMPKDKMIRWMRTASLAARGTEIMNAIAWAKEISDFAKKYEGASSVNFFMNSFGDVSTVHWFADYDNLASFEKVSGQIREDQKFFEILEKGKDFVVEGSAYDTVMRLF